LSIFHTAAGGQARLAAKVNGSVENTGARRLQTVMERVLDEVSFTVTDRSGESLRIDRDSSSATSATSRRTRIEPVHTLSTPGNLETRRPSSRKKSSRFRIRLDTEWLYACHSSIYRVRRMVIGAGGRQGKGAHPRAFA
jgi:hypothetical protein